MIYNKLRDLEFRIKSFSFSSFFTIIDYIEVIWETGLNETYSNFENYRKRGIESSQLVNGIVGS